MSDVQDALGAVLGAEQPAEDAVPAWTRLLEATKGMSVEDGQALLDAAEGPFVVPDSPWKPHSTMVLLAVGENPVPDYVDTLESLAGRLPRYARPQIVRSLFEIAARSQAEEAVRAGLRLTQRFVKNEEAEFGERDDIFYWLVRSTPFPKIVLGWLPALVTHTDLRVKVDTLKAAYQAAGHRHDPAAATMLTLSSEDICVLAEAPSGELAHAVIDHLEAATRGSDPDMTHRTITSMPSVVVTTWATWWVKAEVNNGGFNQYFWNPAGTFAIEAVGGFEHLGRADLADLMRAAIASFLDSEPEIRPFRRNGSLEAFSASYELRTFEELDRQFSDMDAHQSITFSLHKYLIGHLDELADALAQP